MDTELNTILLHLGNAVLAHHQSIQELMGHVNDTGDQEVVKRLLSNQERAIQSLQQFVASVEAHSAD